MLNKLNQIMLNKLNRTYCNIFIFVNNICFVFITLIWCFIDHIQNYNTKNINFSLSILICQNLVFITTQIVDLFIFANMSVELLIFKIAI